MGVESIGFIMRKVKREYIILIIGIVLAIVGVCWFYYLSHIYPVLIPPHGGSEKFELKNGSCTLLWQPLSKCRLWVITEKPVNVYLDGRFVEKGKKVMMLLTPGPHNVTVTSQEPVSGEMIARQDPPVPDFVVSAALLIIGLLIIASPFVPKKEEEEKGEEESLLEI